jgi:uncharacterized GH25 family protein
MQPGIHRRGILVWSGVIKGDQSMKRYLIGVMIFVLSVPAASAHFIFIVPDGPGDTNAKLVFSEDLRPDAAVPIGKVGSTRLFVRGGDKNGSELKLTQGDHAYVVEISRNGPAVIGGKCVYGLMRRGKGKPILLTYHPKYIRGSLTVSEPWDKLAFEIVPLGGDRFRAVFNGKPAAGIEVHVVAPRAEGPMKTDDKGEFRVDTSKPGVYGLRARQIEQKTGQMLGTKYDQVQHYATLTFAVGQANGGN